MGTYLYARKFRFFEIDMMDNLFMGIKIVSRLKICSNSPRKEFFVYLWSSNTKFPILLTIKELEYFRTELPGLVLVPAVIKKSM